jgi:transcriptional regulator with XRE-family HTH domain
MAQRIDQSLSKLGLTNEEIAGRLDPPGTAGRISHWRLGRHQPDWAMIQQIAAIANVNAYWLLTGNDDPRELIQTFLTAREYLIEAVRSGEDPGETWNRLFHTLTEEQQKLLGGHADEIKQFVVSLDRQNWIELTGEEHRLVRDLIVLLQRRRP